LRSIANLLALNALSIVLNSSMRSFIIKKTKSLGYLRKEKRYKG
jgi:hypothetical protein